MEPSTLSSVSLSDKMSEYSKPNDPSLLNPVNSSLISDVRKIVEFFDVANHYCSVTKKRLSATNEVSFEFDQMYSNKMKNYFDIIFLNYYKNPDRSSEDFILYHKNDQNFLYKNEMKKKQSDKRIYKMVLIKKDGLKTNDEFNEFRINKILLQLLDHRNILKSFETLETDFYFYHITDYAYFDFHKILNKAKIFEYERSKIIKTHYTFQFIMAISYLNKSGITTFSENILDLKLACDHHGYLIISNLPKLKRFDNVNAVAKDFRLIMDFFDLFDNTKYLEDEEFKLMLNNIFLEEKDSIENLADIDRFYKKIIFLDYFKSFNMRRLFHQQINLKKLFSINFEELFDPIEGKNDNFESFKNSLPITSLQFANYFRHF
jgi:hypothetical protein